MTSSGTYSFDPANGELVIAAYERCQIRQPELRPEHMRTAYRELNFAMGKFANLPPNSWKVSLASTTLTQSIASASVSANVTNILDAYVSINTGDSDQTNRIIGPISRSDYAGYGQPQTEGAPSVYWFDRTTSAVYFFPTPDDAETYVFNYYAALRLEDANLADGETPDVPYQWLDALVSELAYRCSRVYAPQLEAARKMDAREAWENAASDDIEDVGFKVIPMIGSYMP
jgi:hypothetical protein